MAVDGILPTVPLPAVLPPDNNVGVALCILTWILFGTSTLLIAGRLFSKFSILRHFGTDDVLMLLSWLSTVAYSVAIQLSYHYGLGRHYEYLSLPLAVEILKDAYIAFAFCIVGPALGRISFTLYLLVIIGNARYRIRYWLWIFIAMQALFNAALLASIYGRCGINIAIIAIPNVGCFHPGTLFRFAQAVGAINVATDALLTVAPTILIVRLQTTRSAKAAAIALLSLSSFAMVAVVWRTIELSTVFAANNWDFTHTVVPYFEAASLEQNIIIISASIPTVAPIYKHAKRRYGKSLSTSGDSSRQLSGDSAELRHNMAQALGVHIPMLGNSVTITAGPLAKDSQEYILPLAELPGIKTTTRTKVEHFDRNGEELEYPRDMRN